MTDETIEPSLAESGSGEQWQPIETAPTDRVIELGRFPNSVGANRVNFFIGDARLCNPEMTHWREHPTTSPSAISEAPTDWSERAANAMSDALCVLTQCGDEPGGPDLDRLHDELRDLTAAYALSTVFPSRPSAISEAPTSADAGMREALEAARQFIVNGVELGFIHIPKNDPAEHTLRKISAALKDARNE